MCGFSTVELLTSYGYSLSIFIPISFAWMIPVEFIRWLLVIVGAVISGTLKYSAKFQENSLNKYLKKCFNFKFEMFRICCMLANMARAQGGIRM